MKQKGGPTGKGIRLDRGRYPAQKAVTNKAGKVVAFTKNKAAPPVHGTHLNAYGRDSSGNLYGKKYGLPEGTHIPGGKAASLAFDGLKAARFLGRVAMPIGIAADVFEVANSQDKVKTGVEKASAWAGALGGAEAGGSIGATVGTFVGGPIGTVVGGAIGALGGGIAGYLGGEQVGDKAVDLGRDVARELMKVKLW